MAKRESSEAVACLTNLTLAIIFDIERYARPAWTHNRNGIGQKRVSTRLKWFGELKKRPF